MCLFCSCDMYEIIEKIKKHYKDGKELNYASVIQYDPILYSRARRKIGSWKSALKYAGIDENKIRKARRYSISDLNKIAEERSGKCLSNNRLGYYNKLQWQCANGHKWESRICNILHRNWCPICKTGINEERCRAILHARQTEWLVSLSLW